VNYANERPDEFPLLNTSESSRVHACVCACKCVATVTAAAATDRVSVPRESRRATLCEINVRVSSRFRPDINYPVLISSSNYAPARELCVSRTQPCRRPPSLVKPRVYLTGVFSLCRRCTGELNLTTDKVHLIR